MNGIEFLMSLLLVTNNFRYTRVNNTQASTVCVVYAADSAETRDRVSSYWLPFVRQVRLQLLFCKGNACLCTGPTNIMTSHHFQHTAVTADGASKLPVILVRNKSDLIESEPKGKGGNKDEEDTNPLVKECWGIMEKFKEIVTCIEVCAWVLCALHVNKSVYCADVFALCLALSQVLCQASQTHSGCIPLRAELGAVSNHTDIRP